MATKLQRAHFKPCNWREPKRQHAGRDNQNASTFNAKRKQKFYLTRVGIKLWILISASSWLYLLSSLLFREWKCGYSTKATL